MPESIERVSFQFIGRHPRPGGGVFEDILVRVQLWYRCPSEMEPAVSGSETNHAKPFWDPKAPKNSISGMNRPICPLNTSTPYYEDNILPEICLKHLQK